MVNPKLTPLESIWQLPCYNLGMDYTESSDLAIPMGVKYLITENGKQYTLNTWKAAQKAAKRGARVERIIVRLTKAKGYDS